MLLQLYFVSLYQNCFLCIKQRVREYMIVSVSNINSSPEDYLAVYQCFYTQSPTSWFSSIKAGLKAGMRYSTPEAALKHYFNGITSYEQEQNDQKQYLEITMKSEMFTTLHCKMEEPVSRAYKEGQLMALKSLSPSQYKRSTFLTPKPDMDYVCDILNKEAKERFKSILFWTYKWNC